MMLKSIFGNREKLVPTQIPTRTFVFKFGMQGFKSEQFNPGRSGIAGMKCKPK